MKDIKQIVEKIQKNPQQLTESSKKLPPKETIEKLWVVLVGMYGASFTSSYGEEVDATGAWRASLYSKTEQQIKNGLANLADSKKDFPPNAVQFRAMCTDTRPNESTDPAHRIFKPEQRLAKGTQAERNEIAQKHLKKLRKDLGMKAKT